MSPAGRVRGRRRAAPSAFVVAAAGRTALALRADTKRRVEGEHPGPSESGSGASREHETASVEGGQLGSSERGAGASREHETARCAVHESPLARDTKASKPLVETRKRFAPFSTRRSKRKEGGRRK